MKGVLYDWGGLNLWLFHLINDLRAPWLDDFMRLGSWLGDPDRCGILLAAAVLWLWVNAQRPGRQAQTSALLTTLAVFSAGYVLDGLLVSGLKTALDFPRPPRVLPPDTLHVIGEAAFNRSLPSGHAAFSMLAAASFWPRANHPWRLALVLFVIWVGLSRVSLGAHFPADVVAGWMLAFSVVRLLYRGAEYRQKRQAGEQ
ncbi:MAG: phosphatase PAP2 family protein [Rugosibacter sp.]|nr:phosphatase PAP2 family protein [Rugosibacter sp.]